jgi:hypothetical protein
MFRLSLQNIKDREFLEKRGVDIKALLKEEKDRYIESARENVLETGENVNKHKNKVSYYQNIRFDSKFELNCWLVLLELEKEGIIKNLQRQLKVTFTHNGVKLLGCRPDFYFEVEVNEKPEVIYADAKNPITAKLRPFRITQNLFKAFYGREMLVFLDLNLIKGQILKIETIY